MSRFRQDYNAGRCLVSMGDMGIPEADGNQLGRTSLALRRVGNGSVREQQVECFAIRARNHGNAFAQAAEHLLLTSGSTMGANVEILRDCRFRGFELLDHEGTSSGELVPASSTAVKHYGIYINVIIDK